MTKKELIARLRGMDTNDTDAAAEMLEDLYTEPEALLHVANILEKQNKIWRTVPFGPAPKFLREQVEKMRKKVTA